MGRWIIAALLIACSSSCARPEAPPALPRGVVVDLSHDLGPETIFWPTSTEGFRLEKVADGITEQGFYYSANNFASAEHGGTHIDAPSHFARGHQTVDQIPLDRLIGQAVVVDVAQQSSSQPDYQVSKDDLAAWERVNGPIEPDSIVLLRTGYSSYWPDAARYLGTNQRGAAAVALLHFPGLHPEAARWLVEERRIKSVGIDTASIDFGQSMQFETHRMLFEHDTPAFENLTALDRLPIRGAFVMALPIKIKGGSGGPLRAAAIVPGQEAR